MNQQQQKSGENHSENKTLNIGIIGCGHWGPNHIRTLQSIEACSVRIAADLSEPRRTAMGQQFPKVDFTENSDDIICPEDIDVVFIATPTASHYTLCKQALLADKHVFCEKPLTLLAHESLELTQLAESRGLILMVGHVFLFNPGILYLKEQIDAGILGDIFYMDAVRTNLGPIRHDVGAIYDLASHDISIFNFLLGTMPQTVTAVGGKHIQSDHEDMAFLTLSYPNESLCHVHVSWLNPRKVRQLTVVGDKKMAVWDDMNALEPVRIYDKGLEEKPYYNSFGQFQMILRDADITIPKIKMFEPLRQQAEHFIGCIQNRKTPLSDGRSATGVVQVLEAAMQSLQNQGQPIPVASLEPQSN